MLIFTIRISPRPQLSLEAPAYGTRIIWLGEVFLRSASTSFTTGCTCTSVATKLPQLLRHIRLPPSRLFGVDVPERLQDLASGTLDPEH